MIINYDIPITIANVLIELISPLSASELGIEKRLGPFFGYPEDEKARINLKWEESLTQILPNGELIYDPGLIWQVYRSGSSYQALMTFHTMGKKPQVKVLLHTNATWDELILIEQRKGDKWQSTLNIGAGELIFRTAIIFTGGIVFHSSALDDNGSGILFVGHSGEGKSTLADLWNQKKGVTIINQDRNAVRVDAGKPICYGTPWGGTAEIALNHQAPLNALILLEKAPVNEIKIIKPNKAASLLAARAFLPFWDSYLMDLALKNLNEIIYSVPVYMLLFRPEKDVIDLVRSIQC